MILNVYGKKPRERKDHVCFSLGIGKMSPQISLKAGPPLKLPRLVITFSGRAQSERRVATTEVRPGPERPFAIPGGSDDRSQDDRRQISGPPPGATQPEACVRRSGAGKYMRRFLDLIEESHKDLVNTCSELNAGP